MRYNRKDASLVDCWTRGEPISFRVSWKHRRRIRRLYEVVRKYLDDHPNTPTRMNWDQLSDVVVEIGCKLRDLYSERDAIRWAVQVIRAAEEDMAKDAPVILKFPPGGRRVTTG